jgi:hypothetical protein
VLNLAVNIVASNFRGFKQAVGISDTVIRRLAGSFEIDTFHECASLPGSTKERIFASLENQSQSTRHDSITV